MKLIVELYRYLLLLCFVLLIAVGAMWAYDLSQKGINLGTIISSASLLATFVGGILLLGMTAIFFSINDRHAELVKELRGLRADFNSNARPEV